MTGTLVFFMFWALCENNSGAETIALERLFQSTSPKPKYIKYDRKSFTANTTPYTNPKEIIDKRLDKPSQ